MNTPTIPNIQSPISNPYPWSFPRYLAAKRGIDDRSLNRPVWDHLAAAVAGMAGTLDRPLRVLEIGAGIGTMAERTLAWGLFAAVAQGVAYTLLDVEAENMAAAQERLLPGQAQGQERVAFDFVTADILAFAQEKEAQARYDLLIAHAVLDLLDLPTALPRLLRLLRPGGLAYFTLNFDGVTSFQPVIDPALDDQIEALYHRSMDERLINGQPSGDHRSGRRLLGLLPTLGVEILAGGSSDWVVFPQAGGYAGDEAYFLHHILHFFEQTLSSHPALESARFHAWLAQRRQQIDQGQLSYVAHQIDFLIQIGRG